MRSDVRLTTPGQRTSLGPDGLVRSLGDAAPYIVYPAETNSLTTTFGRFSQLVTMVA
jgi:hypothetical protein